MVEIQLLDEKKLSEVLDLCNQNMEFDHLSETLLREKIYDDANYDRRLHFTAYGEGQVVGFVSGVMREIGAEKIGYIKLMVVRKEYRRRGIGKELYERLENILYEQGASKIRVYDVPFNYFMPGIDPRYTPALAFFETLGFRRFADTSNLIVDLKQDFDTAGDEERLKAEGIEINRAGYEERDEILHFVDESFPLWRTEVENTYNSLPISLHIARQKGEVKAFSAHNGNNFGTGWFGPMGTHPDLRGKGIGGILLKRCLQDMKEWGLTQSIIPWVGPIRFYAYYVNARVDRVFWRYEKVLKPVH